MGGLKGEGRMANFEHYMYVLECVDGSLYTGYTTDVAARVAKHNSGKGAKCTRSRRPVSLLASARFYTKQRAMSAEFRFKKLSRDQKDALLARAAKRPFEQVLEEGMPAFGPAPMREFVARGLAESEDAAYKAFQAPLIPSMDASAMVGVRTPVLRKMAKAMAKRADVQDFLADVPHRLFEENQLHAFVVGEMRDYAQALEAVEAFLPYVDNWATCDQIPTKVLAQDRERTLEAALRWVADDRVYVSRFGMGVLLQHYLDDWFEPRFLQVVANRRIPGFEKPQPASEAYYHNMMRAWYFAEAVAKQPEAAVPVLLGQADVQLDEWTRKKAIQKSVESFRVPDEVKTLLKAAR